MILPSLIRSLIRSRSRTSVARYGEAEPPDELQMVAAGHAAADLDSV